jgi:hypothetical protein
MFDADAGELPQLKVRGRIYTGRLISFDALAKYEPGLLKLGREELSSAELRLLVFRFFRETFPSPWWKVWDKSVAWHVIKLPLKKQMEAFFHFFHLQRKANVGEAPLQSPTSGSDSPPPSTAETPAPAGSTSPTSDVSPDSSASTATPRTRARSPASGRRRTARSPSGGSTGSSAKS